MSEESKRERRLEPVELLPRGKDQGYRLEDLERRRRWLAERTSAELRHVSASTLPPAELRGNVENAVGSCQVPLGVAGPLRVRGEHADGTFYVPLATTEGSLVRSYERGMVLLTRSGGAVVHVLADANTVSPIFSFEDVSAARRFASELPGHLEMLRERAHATTEHGRLLAVAPTQLGRDVIVDFRYSTGDAGGMNMIVRATEQACVALEETLGARWQVFSGHESEKRASAGLLRGGKGKTVVAGALIPQDLLQLMMRLSPQEVVELRRLTALGHLQAGAIGYNGHLANGLAALFIACGQDVANVANCAVGITSFEVTEAGDLYASVTVPSLVVASVGGGTGLGTARECLQLLGCYGSGKAQKLAEICAATLLAGELSFAAAIATGELVASHERYGRNRPRDDG